MMTSRNLSPETLYVNSRVSDKESVNQLHVTMHRLRRMNRDLELMGLDTLLIRNVHLEIFGENDTFYPWRVMKILPKHRFTRYIRKLIISSDMIHKDCGRMIIDFVKSMRSLRTIEFNCNLDIPASNECLPSIIRGLKGTTVRNIHFVSMKLEARVMRALCHVLSDVSFINFQNVTFTLDEHGSGMTEFTRAMCNEKSSNRKLRIWQVYHLRESDLAELCSMLRFARNLEEIIFYGIKLDLVAVTGIARALICNNQFPSLTHVHQPKIRVLTLINCSVYDMLDRIYAGVEMSNTLELLCWDEKDTFTKSTMEDWDYYDFIDSLEENLVHKHRSLKCMSLGSYWRTRTSYFSNVYDSRSRWIALDSDREKFRRVLLASNNKNNPFRNIPDDIAQLVGSFLSADNWKKADRSISRIYQLDNHEKEDYE